MVGSAHPTLGKRMKKILVIAMLAWSGISCAEPPQILTDAVNAYKKNGYSNFLPVLAKGSGVEKEKSITALTAIFPTVEDYFGKIEGLEVLREVQTSSKIKNTYFVLNYEKGPLYGMVTTYQSPKGELLTHIVLNAMGSIVLPSSLIDGEK